MSCNSSAFRYCPCCGGLLETRRRGDRDRLVCRECRRVLYVNPAVGVAVVVRRGEAILWGRRNSGPYRGAWCIPCGYVEWGEEVRGGRGPGVPGGNRPGGGGGAGFGGAFQLP